jgi:oligopeptide/dipeptide ABC transporter ATP-binding protein
MEEAPAAELYKRGLHPYTALLFSSVSGLPEQIPDIKTKMPEDKALNIPVTPFETASLSAPAPLPEQSSTGCVFADRCKYAEKRCFTEHPQMREIETGHRIRCFNF